MIPVTSFDYDSSWSRTRGRHITSLTPSSIEDPNLWLPSGQEGLRNVKSAMAPRPPVGEVWYSGEMRPTQGMTLPLDHSLKRRGRVPIALVLLYSAYPLTYD
ncbi:hypothetical protein TNCV_2486701 [Trichonephila clavipes]|uniref:Uncharacterized protein n=1 Tax=Trichonephila clavipes TaxID=2585209 RepID=A0A8X6VZS7_TRICX|nr:hypothetical protein TNCV_2486701 [Trichonephila clavipes]